MEAVVFREFGKPQIKEVPRPEPGTTDVLINVDRVQLSVTECRLFHGEKISYYKAIEKRLKQGETRLFGHEFCGTVEEVGDDVTRFEPGDRVYAPGKIPCMDCPYCNVDQFHLCTHKKIIGMHTPGALSEYTCLPEKPLCKLPEDVSDAAGAAMQPLASSLLSVYETDINLGDVVVVIGSGVMGFNCAQLVQEVGAGQVFALDLVPEKLEIAKAHGIEPVDVSGSDPAAILEAATHGIGADVVFEAVGGEQDHVQEGSGPLSQAFDLVRQGGKIVQVGNIPGDVAINPGNMRRKSVDWLNPNVGVCRTSPNASTGEIAARYVADGDVNLDAYVTHELRGLAEIERAIEITMDPDTGLGPAQLIP